MYIDKNLKKPYEIDKNKEYFKNFLIKNGIKSILTSDNHYANLISNNDLTYKGEQIYEYSKEANTPTGEFCSYLLSNQVPLQTLLSFKGTELREANDDELRKNYMLQQFRSVSDSTLLKLVNLPEYKSTKSLESKLNTEYKKCGKFPLLYIPDPIYLLVSIPVHILCTAVSGCIAWSIYPNDTSKTTLGFLLPTIIFVVLFFLYNLKSATTTCKAADLRKQYQSNTYGAILDAFTERKSAFKY